MKSIRYSNNSMVTIKTKKKSTKEFVDDIITTGSTIDLSEIRKYCENHPDDKKYLGSLIASGKTRVRGVRLNDCIRLDDNIIPYPSILLIPDPEDNEIIQIEDIERSKKLGLLNL